MDLTIPLLLLFARGTRFGLRPQRAPRAPRSLAAFLKFTTSPDAIWAGNFRDLNSAIERMATLASGGRISIEIVDEELQRLRRQWARPEAAAAGTELVAEILGEERAAELDRFDRVQLADVLQVCRTARSLSEAGRVLFAETRKKKHLANDADRLRKYLARFGLEWSGVLGEA